MNTDADLAVCDSESARLLPWFLTGRLAADDQQRVGRHLDQCAACRAELEEQRLLRAAMRAEPTVELAPQAGLARTLERIDELGRELAREPAAATSALPATAPRTPMPSQAHVAHVAHPTREPRWLVAAVIVQALLLCGLGARALLGTRAVPASYQTLSNADAAARGARIRVVFDAAMPVGGMRELLATRGLAIVDGPSEAGVYTLRPASGKGADLVAAARTLRADHRVMFAEAVGTDGAEKRPP